MTHANYLSMIIFESLHNFPFPHNASKIIQSEPLDVVTILG